MWRRQIGNVCPNCLEMTAFLFSFICSAGAYWVLLKQPSPLLVLDTPTARGLHQTSVPRGGGIVITATSFVCCNLDCVFELGSTGSASFRGLDWLGYRVSAIWMTATTCWLKPVWPRSSLLMGLVVLATLDSAVWRFFRLRG